MSRYRHRTSKSREGTAQPASGPSLGEQLRRGTLWVRVLPASSLDNPADWRDNAGNHHGRLRRCETSHRGERS